MSDTDSGIATVAEAASVAADAVRSAEAVAVAENAEVVAAVIEGAQQRVEAAEQMAQQITQAALETELGRQIAENNRRISEWLDGEGRALRNQVETLQAEMSALRETVAATATLALTSADTPQSTPPVSEQPIAEAVETVTEILPETVTSQPAESTHAEPAPKRRKVFL